jgi:hypothetical protein
MPNSAFCYVHRLYCPRKSPLTGWEPKYEPDRWNKKNEIRETHNCFSYAMNVHDPKQIEACLKSKNCNVPYHQPGSAAGQPGFKSDRLKTCSEMIVRILGDNPSIKMATFTDKCPAQTSKIAIVVDPDEDYHFYRQDSSGYWSHKPGGMKVTNKDQSGLPIYDPRLANRRDKEGRLDYNVFCSYLCVPRTRHLHLKIGGYKKTRSSSKARRAASPSSLTRRHRRI